MGGNTTATASQADVYNPATGTWSVTGSMSMARANHTASVLSSGKVLVSGGSNNLNATTASETYDPSTGP